MPLADDLTKAEIKSDAAGRVLAVGLAGGWAYLEISEDAGATPRPWPDGAVRQPVCAADEEPPTLEVFHDGTLIVCATQSGLVRTFLSRDDGEHWEGL